MTETHNVPHKVVIPDDCPPVISDTPALVRLRSAPGVEVKVYDNLPTSRVTLANRIHDAHTVVNIRSSTRFGHDTLASAPGLKHLAVWGPGVDNVDLDAAKRLGIAVTNTPDTAAVAVAEHALALLLAVAHKVCQLDDRVRRGEWPRGLITQLHGKTLGLMGVGAIGTQMARLGRGIGMNVIGWTLHPDLHRDAGENVHMVDLPTLLAESDAISIHLRGSAATRRILGWVEFSQMKPTAFLVNTGRGSVIDENALYEALRDGALAGAGLDVFATEPLDPHSPLRTLPNVVLSPHTASTTDEALESSLNMLVDNILGFLDGVVMHRVV